MSETAVPRHLRLMADYECFPLWEDGEGLVGNVDPASLPISAELQIALQQWATRYDATLNREDPAQSGFASYEDEEAFLDEAKSLLQCLKTELGGAYSVRLQAGKGVWL